VSLAVAIRASIQASQTKTGDLESAASTIDKAMSVAFSDGVGSNQANRIWKDTRTLAASASENLDLSGSLTDIYGDAVVFARIKALIVIASAVNANNVNVARHSSTGVPIYLAASDGEPVHPGGFLVKVWPGATGIPVTAGTGDLLTITNSAGGSSVDYTIVVVGAST
jgi:hypothetical protein